MLPLLRRPAQPLIVPCAACAIMAWASLAWLPALAGPAEAATGADSAAATSAVLAAPAYTLADSGSYGHPGEGTSGLSSVSGIATDAFGHLWVVDGGGSRLVRWQADGQWLSESGSLGSDANQFRRPKSVTRLGSSGVAVLDVENHRIVTYDLLGRLAVVLVQLDASALEDQTGRITPVAMAADRGGALYVADGERDRVLVFDFSGKYVRTVGAFGTARGSFHGLAAVAVTANGELVTIEHRPSLPRKRASAADSAVASGARVQRLDAGGAPIAAWQFPAGVGLEDDFALAVDDSGRVAVASLARGEVSLYSRDGALLVQRGGFATPSALAFAPDGALLVGESEKGRIRRLVLLAATKP